MTAILNSSKAGPLPAYLRYLFLRFPGTLAEEETWDLECLDTYDRRWSSQGQVWVRHADQLRLVSPPSLFAVESTPDAGKAFGLQVPVLLGRVKVHVRVLHFQTTEPDTIVGQVLRFRTGSLLVLRGSKGNPFSALLAALAADGLEPASPESFPWDSLGAFRFASARAWPAPVATESASDFLVGRIRDGLRLAGQYEKGIKDDIDTECLHQYRVNLRRARSLLALGRQWQTAPAWSRLKAVLKTLCQVTNPMRDLDVLLLDLPRLQGLLPWGEGAGLESWADSVAQKRTTVWRMVRAWLGSEDYKRLVEEADKLLNVLAVEGEPWTVGELAISAFGRSTRSLKKGLKALGDSPTDEALHEIRIQTKSLRYVIDALGSLGPPPVVKFLTASLKITQEGLGQFQDRSILLQRLKSEIESLRSLKASSSTDLLSFGILVGVLTAGHGEQKRRALKDSRTLGARPFLKALGQLAGYAQKGEPHGA